MTDSAERFAEAFLQAWKAAPAATSNGSAFRHQKRDRTRTMLDEENAVLRVASRRYLETTLPGKDIQPVAWYTVDQLYVRRMANAVINPNATAADDLRVTGKPWPNYWRHMAELAIEHENASDIESEVWKLIHWRCPLKVLVFYDFDMKDREFNRPYRSDRTLGQLTGIKCWLPKKFVQIADMIQASQSVVAEPDGQYLFIVGRPHAWTDGAPVAWGMYRWDAAGSKLVSVGDNNEFGDI